jgi:DNA-binding transcriptional LysR family regulator
MDTLTSIKVFRQVVESGSFVAAGERLDLSTASISKHVMSVERRLGVRLLNRNCRKLSLTEPGRVYFERCKNILEDLHATELELACLGSKPRGTLRVSLPSFAGGRRVADLLAEHHRLYPEVLVDASFEDRFVDLIEEGFDLALRVTSNSESLSPGLVARPIRPAMFYLVASHEYVRRHGLPEVPEELAHHDFVAVGDLSSLSLLGSNGRTNIPLHVVLRYRSMSEVANAIAAGIGIGAVPALIFEHPAFKDMLTPILPTCPVREAMLYVVYASRKFLPLKVRTFVDFIIESLSATTEPKPPRRAEAYVSVLRTTP